MELRRSPEVEYIEEDGIGGIATSEHEQFIMEADEKLDAKMGLIVQCAVSNLTSCLESDKIIEMMHHGVWPASALRPALPAKMRSKSNLHNNQTNYSLTFVGEQCTKLCPQVRFRGGYRCRCLHRRCATTFVWMNFSTHTF